MDNQLFSAIDLDMLAFILEGPRTFDELLAWGKAEFAHGPEEQVHEIHLAAIRRLVTRGLVAVSQSDDVEKTLDAAKALLVLDDAAASTLFVRATPAGRELYTARPLPGTSTSK